MAISLSEQLEVTSKNIFTRLLGHISPALMKDLPQILRKMSSTHRISIMDITTMMTSPSHSSE